MFTKPKAYYEGKTAYNNKVERNKNPFTWAGNRNKGNEAWWFTGFDDAERKSNNENK